jgi:hypothetical protein
MRTESVRWSSFAFRKTLLSPRREAFILMRKVFANSVTQPA